MNAEFRACPAFDNPELAEIASIEVLIPSVNLYHISIPIEDETVQ